MLKAPAYFKQPPQNKAPLRFNYQTPPNPTCALINRPIAQTQGHFRISNVRTKDEKLPSLAKQQLDFLKNCNDRILKRLLFRKIDVL